MHLANRSSTTWDLVFVSFSNQTAKLPRICASVIPETFLALANFFAGMPPCSALRSLVLFLAMA